MIFIKRKVSKGRHILLILLLIFVFTGCQSGSTYNIEQFKRDMEAKSYDLKMKDAGEDFLPTERIRMEIGKETLDIYIFNSDYSMENTAKNIDRDGSGYSSGSKSMKVDWIAPPHFFKKGSIIVQYIGENKKVISDLNNILGEQFAGAKN